MLELQQKLNQFGIKINDKYDVEQDETYFHCEKMIVVYNKVRKNILISFNANVKPDEAGKIIIILNQLNTPIEIIDSHIYDEDNNMQVNY